MNTFNLDGPGGIPGLKQIPQGSSAIVNQPFQFNKAVAFLGGVTGQTQTILDATASTLTLTAAQSGAVVMLDRAAGVTVSLPADAPGLAYTFIVVTTVTSNSYKVITTTASSFLQGYLNVPVSAGTAKYFYGDGSTLISVNLNGTTTGGLAGGRFTMRCLKSGLWQVEGDVEGSGTVATPFATS